MEIGVRPSLDWWLALAENCFAGANWKATARGAGIMVEKESEALARALPLPTASIVSVGARAEQTWSASHLELLSRKIPSVKVALFSQVITTEPGDHFAGVLLFCARAT